MTQDLIPLLADGQFHSGLDLGKRLGISRSAVWKRVSALKEVGISVDAVQGKGYRIPGGLDLLAAGVVQAALAANAQAAGLRVEVRDVVDSTNTLALEGLRAGKGRGQVYLAEFQTAGRGRRGKEWLSPYARNIYCSLVWTLEQGIAAAQGLSLAIGVALCSALRGMGVQGAGVKWPNDVQVNGSKICGVLVEVAGDIDGACALVIGFGVNVDMERVDASAIGQPWTDLRSQGCRQPRNEIAARCIRAVAEALHAYEQRGLANVLAAWPAHDVLTGRVVSVHIGERITSGLVRGIDRSGGLVVEVDGEARVFHAGEVSVRQ